MFSLPVIPQKKKQAYNHQRNKHNNQTHYQCSSMFRQLPFIFL
ncbi:hypothetical protein DXB67_20155 [Bacteroides caccae]|nr:hypothetical protein DXB67_20155 [Bacteroides caccae]